MSFLDIRVFGVALWMILYLIMSIVLFLGVLAYWYRERIRKVFYGLKSPEKLVKVVIHFSGSMYKVYWRLIPDYEFFKINNRTYMFQDENTLKDHDFYIRGKDRAKTTIKVEGEEYNLEDINKIKSRSEKYTEIHYVYENPKPLDFNLAITKGSLDFTSKELDDSKDNDLFVKLLTLNEEQMKSMFILMAVVLNLLLTGFLVSKEMGWI